MAESSIEWTDFSWNPTTGCRKISPGCDHCYAAAFAHRGLSDRHRGLTVAKEGRYDWTGEVRLHEDLVEEPLRWRTPRHVFVDSMSDLFHPKVPATFIRRVFSTMNLGERHRFQILTKQSKRLLKLGRDLVWSPNIWMGVSVETERFLSRIDDLRQTGAAIKFLSLEPLLGPLPGLDLTGINWVIVGGESGPKARLMEEAWVLDVRDRCRAARVPFFFKQWGVLRNNPFPGDATAKKNGGQSKGGRMLRGRTWDGMPDR